MMRRKNVLEIIQYAAIILFLACPLFTNSSQSSTFFDLIPSYVMLVLFYVLTRKRIILRRDSIIIFLFYVNALFSTVINAFTSGIALDRTLITYALFCIYYILFTSQDFSPDNIARIKRIYYYLALVASVLVILSAVTGRAYSWSRYSFDVIGLKKNPNYITGYILGVFGWVLFDLLNIDRNNRNTNQLFQIIALGLMFLSFLLSGSRAAILSSGIVALFVFLFTVINKGIKPGRMITIILVIVAALASIHFTVGLLPDKMISRMQFSNIANSDDVRLTLWEAAFEKYRQGNVIFGMGVNGVEKYTNSYIGLSLHGEILQLLMEQGITGVLLFILLLTSNKLRSKKNRLLLTTITISLYAPIFFHNGLYAIDFWFPLILRNTIAVSLKKEEELGEVLS